MPEVGPLTTLAIKNQSDKWGGHSYTKYYEGHFAAYRDRAISLLEIGIGGYNHPELGGSSLKMWASYFTSANIFALDIFDKSCHGTDRVRIYQGSQSDGDLLLRIHDESGGLDIVIDDGSHRCEHVISSFTVLIPLLKPGGLYVVEDTQTSYWPAYGGSSENPDAIQTTMGFFKDLIHGLSHDEIIRGVRAPDYLEANILSIHFYHNLIFIYKGDNTEPSNTSREHSDRKAESFPTDQSPWG